MRPGCPWPNGPFFGNICMKFANAANDDDDEDEDYYEDEEEDDDDEDDDFQCL